MLTTLVRLSLCVRFNNHLRKKNYPPIENPATDFESGIKLMQIVNALYDVPIPKHNANPKLRPHKLDNIETALKMVEQAKIKTNFLKHTHLIDHDNKMILGMMWASTHIPHCTKHTVVHSISCPVSPSFASQSSSRTCRLGRPVSQFRS